MADQKITATRKTYDNSNLEVVILPMRQGGEKYNEFIVFNKLYGKNIFLNGEVWRHNSSSCNVWIYGADAVHYKRSGSLDSVMEWAIQQYIHEHVKEPDRNTPVKEVKRDDI